MARMARMKLVTHKVQNELAVKCAQTHTARKGQQPAAYHQMGIHTELQYFDYNEH